ncbi:MAG: hypothetical protein KatS3mg031_0912 [Chitinophagales bacterium]|nr:MAG: hypothetical protein KatS3mg031_0912 [Chitinophagales bacterium]
MTTRREFLSACGTCLAAAGAGLMLQSFIATRPVFKIQDDELMVPLASFEKKNTVIMPYPDKGDILIRKNEDNSFLALLLVCTHRNGKVVESGKVLKCTKHGSLFNPDGSVKSGKATEDLKRFPVEIRKDQVVVKIS